VAVKVTETFFSLQVEDMGRATAFYVDVFGAEARFATAQWSSLFVAQGRIGLFLNPGFAAGRTGLHFVVDDLERACDDVARRGGAVVTPPTEVAPGVVVADVRDTEGNVLSLRRA
jgi:predicted enzyme related to lactoylglutathione lyase